MDIPISSRGTCIGHLNIKHKGALCGYPSNQLKHFYRSPSYRIERSLVWISQLPVEALV